jgi:ubiquinol-cytochrome c reductase cytochrome b subunit
LHSRGSSNPTGSSTNIDKVKFHPLFSIKDLTPAILIIIIIIIIISKKPDLLGDVENLNAANPLVTPIHIQPEWYFLFAYAILRSIPSKLGGVVALLASITILSVLTLSKKKSGKFSPAKKIKFWLIVGVFVILT